MKMNLRMLFVASLILPQVAAAAEDKYTVYVEAALLYKQPVLPGEENTSILLKKLASGTIVIEKKQGDGHHIDEQCKKASFPNSNRQVYDWIYTKDWACVKIPEGTIGWIHRMFIH